MAKKECIAVKNGTNSCHRSKNNSKNVLLEDIEISGSKTVTNWQTDDWNKRFLFLRQKINLIYSLLTYN